MERLLYRKTWAEIDLKAIEYNLLQMRKMLPTTSEIIAVVKANAYGHGSVKVAKKALDAGATALAVALLEEALVLREAAIDAPILVLGWVAPEYAKVAAENNITLTFFQKEWLEQVNSYTYDHDLKLHMKWDTGMGRIGIRNKQELVHLIPSLTKNPRVLLTGVFTHFATADAKDLSFFHEQRSRFEKMLHFFKEIWRKPVAIHVGNSAASMRFPEEMHNYIRFGISMYGLYPSNTVKSEQPILLKPAFSLHSKLIHVKKVAAGSTISYGQTYRAEQDEWIGTIPIGYADGWLRKLQGTDVLVDGKRMSIVGRICMDQTMIRLDKEYEIGTKVTLIGSQGNDSIEMDEVAAHLDTINYEIPCIISDRVPRVYLE